MENMINTEEAAKLLGLCRSTLEHWRHQGIGPVFHKLGRRVVYRPSTLLAWASSQAFTSTEDYQDAGSHDVTDQMAG
jgi:predicted DNA-binding transcriptional regulator AlpA